MLRNLPAMPDAAPVSEYLIISSSLRANSLSRILAEAMAQHYAELKAHHRLVDLREYTLPLCDGGAAYGHPHVATLSGLIGAARVIIVATPIYNYDANAAMKNLVELTGGEWENKTVGFVCAAGGPSSYMSIMGLANSLMLDFRCLIIPRFVYAQGDDFIDKTKPKDEILERVYALADASMKIRNAV
jgi:NAD(P)H-dependent FMN reductase